jgi:archaellum component FlaC
MMTIRERLNNISNEIKEITSKEHMTIEDMNKMNELIQESSRLQKELIANCTKSVKTIYGV